MAKREFEYEDESSHKFWSIELKGESHTVTYGRAGTDGQTKTKAFTDAEAARKSSEKLISQKTSKGYVEKSAPRRKKTVRKPATKKKPATKRKPAAKKKKGAKEKSPKQASSQLLI